MEILNNIQKLNSRDTHIIILNPPCNSERSSIEACETMTHT